MGNKRSYGGRTAIPEKYRRNVFIKVRVTKKEKESIIKLHENSLIDNFSELVREVLFQNKIDVKIVNAEMLALENQLSQIDSKCETFLRKKRESDEALKPIIGVHQKVWGNHAANLISSGSFKDFIALNLGYFFLNSPSQSLFNTLVLA